MDFSHLGFQGLRDIYNVHPMFVHFPIALLPSALLLYFLGVLIERPFLAAAGRMSLYLGTAGGLVAFVTGLAAEDSIPHNESIHSLMETHEALGWLILVLMVLLTLWSFWQVEGQPKGKWLFLAALCMTVLSVAQTADIGARMVYVEGAGVKIAAPLVAPSGQEGVHHHHEGSSGGHHHGSGSNHTNTSTEHHESEREDVHHHTP